MSKRCYYEVLGIEKGADGDSIKIAHRKLAMQYHPDRNPGDKEAEFKFKEVSEAWEVLRDPNKKARYDRYGHAGLDSQGGTDAPMGDLFDILRGFMGGGQQRSRGPRGGGDLQIELTITLEEAFHGTEKTFTAPKVARCGTCAGSGMTAKSQRNACRRCGGQGNMGLFGGTCSNCRGRGVIISDPCPGCRGVGYIETQQEVTVEIPAGIDEGMILPVEGRGHDGEVGGPTGDMHCLFRVRAHSIFTRDGIELHCIVPISISLAALGGTLEVPTLEGKNVNATVPKGAQSGDELHLTGKGMPHLLRNGKHARPGDLVVHLRIITPRNLNKRQEELLRELAEIEGTNPTPERKSWMERVFAFFSGMGKSEEPAPKDKKK